MIKHTPKPVIAKLQLSSSSSMPSLITSISDRKTCASTTRPYPASPFKLNSKRYDAWMARQFREETACDNSIHDIMGEEESAAEESKEPEKAPDSPRQLHVPPIRPGADSIKDFYGKYRDINKSVSPFHQRRRSAAYEYLHELDEMKQPPRPMGIAKWRGPPTELNLHAYKMGNSYAQALSKGLPFLQHDVVKLSDNRLTETGTLALIRELKASIKYLDLSHNTFGRRSARDLGEFIKGKANGLRVLNLENTHLGDTGTIELCGYLNDHPHLSELNLAKNKISDLSCRALAGLVHDTFFLTSLNLHWNAVRGEGAVLLLNAVAFNSNVRVLDLSWNTIGATKSRTFPARMAELLASQENLVHLDLSNNRFDADACAVMAKGLSGNHTLWGMHIIGNEACIDAKGFMHPGKGELNVAYEHLANRINGRMMVVHRATETREVDNCWICEGWNEVLFEWPALNTGKPEPVFLHLECDKYKPDLMCDDPKNKGHYVLWRMCPPGKSKFFFTVEGKALTSTSYASTPCKLTMTIKLNDEVYPYVNVQLMMANVINVPANPSIVKENYEVTIQNAIPRPELGCFLRPKQKKGRAPWLFPKSIFRDYMPDSEEVIQRCFDEDWRRVAKPKMKEEQLQQCKALFRKHYRLIRETYKYYSAIGRTEGLFAINKLTLSDLVAHKIFLLDGDKLTDMELAFMTIKGRAKVGKFQPKTGIIRFEFLEMIFRLALKRFFDTKDVRCESEAVQRLIDVHLAPNCSQFNCHAFREKRYWNEECDNLYKAYYSLLDNIYQNKSGTHKLPGERSFMAYDEFLSIFSDCNLINDIFTERDVISSFAQSMMTQVDELDNSRHMKMQMVEFLEALARAADILSLPPIGSEMEEEEWTQERRETQLLGDKIDNMLPALLGAAKKDFRERFKRPERDLTTGLYIENMTSNLINSGNKDTIFLARL